MRPLPLTVFEQYLLHEDRPGYPNRVVAEWKFSGTIQLDAFAKAAQIIAQRHPMLTAQIKSNWRGKSYWHFSETPILPICWHGKKPTGYWPEFRRSDTDRKVSYECHVVEYDGGWSLFLNQAHVVADGAGSYKAIHELFIAYDNELGGNRKLPPVDVEGLRHRNNYGLTWRKKLSLLPMQVVGFFYAISLLRRKVSLLVPDMEKALEEPQPPGWPNTVSRALSKEDYAKFKTAARENKTSVNNLCMAYFHTAIGEWRIKQGFGDPKDWIRITVPVGLRIRADKNLSACNIFSVVGIDRQAKGLGNRKRLVRRAKEDIDLIQRGWLSLTFLLILWLHRLRPNGIFKMSRKDICRTTAVMTNVGHVYAHSPLAGKDRRLQVGGATLEHIVSTAPYRPHSHVTMQLSLYAGEFCMNLNYNPRVMSRKQADELIECFVEEIRIQALATEVAP